MNLIIGDSPSKNLRTVDSQNLGVSDLRVPEYYSFGISVLEQPRRVGRRRAGQESEGSGRLWDTEDRVGWRREAQPVVTLEEGEAWLWY